MILGAILRNYKCYLGIHYISFYENERHNLNVIIGDNGVGKSTILEAMDSFFNEGTSWIVNSEASYKDSSVGVVLLVEKDKLNSVLDVKEQKIVNLISEAYWALDMTSNGTYEKNYQIFFKQREKISDKRTTHYLIIVGKKYNDHLFNFLSFESYISDSIKETSKKITDPIVLSAINKTVSFFSYLYIPVETTISDFLRLERAEMQVLADKNLKNSISEALINKRITRTTEKKRTKKVSVIDIINEKLEEYIEQIQNEIQKIDKSYDFKPEKRQRSTKLTPNHIASVIIDAYYSRRKLKLNKKPISDLSSGEKRRALIDILYVFLRKNNIDRNLIIAIDEPETSLHISKCYDQFRKVQDIAIKYNQQLFITTHWYGSLPILKNGNLIHINSKQTPSLFNLENYFEDRRNHPDDINLKSFFDLAASIISAYRNSHCHWILVEGIEDKLYLQYYLEKDNIQIIPLSGCGNVKKIYEYLYAPMSNNKQEIPNINEPKILCIVDTDIQNSPINVNSSTNNKLLRIRRWHEDTSHQVELKKIEDSTVTPTEIEEILEPKLFYTALKECIDNYGNNNEKEAFNSFEYDDKVMTSRIKGDYSIINHLGNGRSMRQDKDLIISFIDRMKRNIADTYIKLPKTGNTPTWVNQIKDILEK